MAGYVDALEPIVLREWSLPRGETSFFNNAVRIRALLGILEALPPETATLFSSGVFRLDLRKVDLNLGGVQVENVDATGTTDGRFGSSFPRAHIGPFTLTPDCGELTAEWNLRTGSLDVHGL